MKTQQLSISSLNTYKVLCPSFISAKTTGTSHSCFVSEESTPTSIFTSLLIFSQLNVLSDTVYTVYSLQKRNSRVPNSWALLPNSNSSIYISNGGCTLINGEFSIRHLFIFLVLNTTVFLISASKYSFVGPIIIRSLLSFT